MRMWSYADQPSFAQVNCIPPTIGITFVHGKAFSNQSIAYVSHLQRMHLSLPWPPCHKARCVMCVAVMPCKIHSQRNHGASKLQCRFFSRESHVLLKRCISSMRLLHFDVMLMSSTLAYLWDHVVSGVTILPGAAMLEASLAAQHFSMSPSTSEDHECIGRTNVVSASILSPLALPA